MSNILYAIFAVSSVSIISLVGVFALSLKEVTLDRILFLLLSFSSGSILGTAYLDLLPEAIEFLGVEHLSITVLYITIGFVGFFFLERFIYWFHGHVHGYEHKSEVDERLNIKKFVYLNLIGDGIHNLIDGMIIAAGFLINIPLGLSTTIAVFFHELPQEIGDFGVLVYGGFTRYKALFFNFLSALTAIVGVLISNYFSMHIENFFGFLMALATGGFIYIATSELIPEMQKEENFKRSLIQFAFFVLGIVLIWSLNLLLARAHEFCAQCGCPCGEGIISASKADIVIPANSSNWACYGIEACLARILRNPEVMHNEYTENRMLLNCANAGIPDGATAMCTPTIDGASHETCIYTIGQLRQTVIMSFIELVRESR